MHYKIWVITQRAKILMFNLKPEGLMFFLKLSLKNTNQAELDLTWKLQGMSLATCSRQAGGGGLAILCISAKFTICKWQNCQGSHIYPLLFSTEEISNHPTHPVPLRAFIRTYVLVFRIFSSDRSARKLYKSAFYLRIFIIIFYFSVFLEEKSV